MLRWKTAINRDNSAVSAKTEVTRSKHQHLFLRLALGLFFSSRLSSLLSSQQIVIILQFWPQPSAFYNGPSGVGTRVTIRSGVDENSRVTFFLWYRCNGNPMPVLTSFPRTPKMLTQLIKLRHSLHFWSSKTFEPIWRSNDEIDLFWTWQKFNFIFCFIYFVRLKTSWISRNQFKQVRKVQTTTKYKLNVVITKWKQFLIVEYEDQVLNVGIKFTQQYNRRL